MFDVILSKLLCFKIIVLDNQKKMQLFVVNMTFISSSEAKNLYCIPGFSAHELKVFFSFT